MTTGTLPRLGIPTGRWKVDQARTRVGFAVKQLGFSTVRGEFREFGGALEIGEDLADARAYGRVDATSIDTNLERRDAHLRSTNFLSAAHRGRLGLSAERSRGGLGSRAAGRPRVASANPATRAA